MFDNLFSIGVRYGLQTPQKAVKKGGNKMSKYTISFKVEGYDLDQYRLEDLIKVAVLPTLNLDLVPVTFEVKKAKK